MGWNRGIFTIGGVFYGQNDFKKSRQKSYSLREYKIYIFIINFSYLYIVFLNYF